MTSSKWTEAEAADAELAMAEAVAGPEEASTVAVARQPSLLSLAIRGVAWTVVGQFAGQSLRFAGMLVLTRLLPTTAYGLMGLVNVANRGLLMFSDIGLAPCVIQHRRGEDPAFLRTAWTIQIVRGILLWFISCGIALPLATIYREPSLAQLIPIASLSVLLSSFGSLSLIVLHRRMALGSLTIFDLVTQAVATVVMIASALVWPSVWALVAGGLSAAVFKMVCSHFFLPQLRMGFHWDRDAARDIWRYGRWIFVSTALTFLGTYADRMLMAFYLPMNLFGVFVIAYNMVDAPKDLVMQITGRVMLPAISSRNHLPPAELRDKLLKHRGPMLLAMAVAGALGIALSDQAVYVLLDPEYWDAAWMLPVLLLGLWIGILSGTLEPSLLALDKPYWTSLISFVRLVTVVIGIPLAYRAGGTGGAVVMAALAHIPPYLTCMVATTRIGIGAIGQDMRSTLYLLASLAVFVAIRQSLGWGTPFDMWFVQAG